MKKCITLFLIIFCLTVFILPSSADNKITDYEGNDILQRVLKDTSIDADFIYPLKDGFNGGELYGYKLALYELDKHTFFGIYAKNFKAKPAAVQIYRDDYGQHIFTGNEVFTKAKMAVLRMLYPELKAVAIAAELPFKINKITQKGNTYIYYNVVDYMESYSFWSEEFYQTYLRESQKTYR